MPLLLGALLAANIAMTGGTKPGETCGEGRAWHAPLEACVTLPVLTKRVQPDYEGTAGLDYAAILYLRVSEKGTVADVQIVKAPLEGDPTQEGEAALASLVQAVRQWRFAPGLDPDGKPVALTVVLQLHLRTE